MKFVNWVQDSGLCTVADEWDLKQGAVKRFRYGLLLTVLWSVNAVSGEIPGVPSELPPTIDRPVEITFSNDFLGRGGSVDDFRTQQMILGAPLDDQWLVTLDHSTLTLTDPAAPGRIDQVSASLGYRVLQESTPDRVRRIAVGVGLRGIGDFAGERMQNGFHRLIDSNVESLPYTGDSGTDVTAWVDLHQYGLLHSRVYGDEDLRLGYWLRGTALLTSAGQLDTSAGFYGTLSHGVFDAWLGLRVDGRSGYDLQVLRQTAAAEDDLAVAIGIRWGPLVLETVQQLNNDASYGQLRLISVDRRATPLSDEPVRLGIEAGFQVPDVAYHVGVRYSNPVIAGSGGRWRRSVALLSDFGEPQYNDDSALYLKTTQLGAGVQWERTLGNGGPWTSVYASVGAGMRREQLLGDGSRLGEQSGSVNRGVVLLGLGMRFHAASMGSRWRHRLQLELNASLPVEDAQLRLQSETFQVQEPRIGLLLGMSFDQR